MDVEEKTKINRSSSLVIFLRKPVENPYFRSALFLNAHAPSSPLPSLGRSARHGASFMGETVRHALVRVVLDFLLKPRLRGLSTCGFRSPSAPLWSLSSFYLVSVASRSLAASITMAAKPVNDREVSYSSISWFVARTTTRASPS